MKNKNRMRKVEVNINIRTEPEKVIKAFTDPDMLRDWWSVEKTLIEKKEGGLYTLVWNVTEKGFEYVSTGIIEKYLKDKELTIGNFVYLSPTRQFLGPMTLTIKAIKRNGFTEVYLCQDGYQSGGDWDWYYNAVKEAWPKVMQTFKEYLEKGKSISKY